MRKSSQSTHSIKRMGLILGLGLVLIGAVIVIAQLVKTSWIAFLSLPLIGVVIFVLGRYFNNKIVLNTGIVLFFLGAGSLLAIGPMSFLPVMKRIGILFLLFGAGWLMVFVISLFNQDYAEWWAIVPACLTIGMSIPLIIPNSHWTGYLVFPLAGGGISLIAWGSGRRLLGLIISGCIVLSAGIGLIVWGGTDEQSLISRSGLALIILGAGWVLMTILAKICLNRFIWWALIPGGVTIVVGCGLSLGGNPDNATNFLGNTGSIALFVIGFYLLLMRRGIQQ